MSNLVIHVIGLGIQCPVELPHSTLELLRSAQCIIGWQRHKELIGPLLNTEHFKTVTKLAELSDLFVDYAYTAPTQKDKQHICVVATGDPLFFGIGQWIGKQCIDAEIYYYPAVSSIQTACHRQGLSLQDVTVISLHGRPVQTIRTQLKKNTTLAVLTDRHSTPQVLATECINAGFDDSVITVHENLGYAHEKSWPFTAAALAANEHQFESLHVTVIEVVGQGLVLPEFPGIPDVHFLTGAEPGKGMISKREVRLAILSFMQPTTSDTIWDVGAGCGGVAVELSYWNTKVNVYAVEYHPERLSYLKQNRERFGVVQNLHIIEGKAPQSLTQLPSPNKVFIGGNDGELKNLLTLVWAKLPIGGLLVASGVIETTKQTLRSFSEHIAQLNYGDVESIEMGVKRGSINQGALNYMSKLPVEIFKLTKTSSNEIPRDLA